MIKAAILTISDSCSRGEREDLSGPAIKDLLLAENIEALDPQVVPDEEDVIARRLERLCDETDANVVITTGGTGLGPRDVTPEATLAVCERLVPGLMEATRAEGYTVTIWNRIDKTGSVEFNHIEDGHSETDSPTPMNDVQEKAWTKSQWEKKFGYLDENCVVVEETV